MDNYMVINVLLNLFDGLFERVADKVNLFFGQSGIHWKGYLIISHILCLRKHCSKFFVGGELMDCRVVYRCLYASSMDVLTDFVTSLLVGV